MNLITRLWPLFPGRRTLMTAAISSVLGGAMAVGVSAWLRTSQGTVPGPRVDRRFVALGRAYLPHLGQAYAAAWDEGAQALDGGQGIAAALDRVAQTWTANRTDIYHARLTPELAKIVRESTKDTDVTPAQRAQMAAAWRGLAHGLR